MKLNDFNQSPKKPRKVIREMHEDQACGQTPEPDHEVNMARSDLYSLVKNAAKIHDILTHVTEHEGLRGWQQSYITLAADYINSVYDSLSYDEHVQEAEQGSDLEDACWRNYKAVGLKNQDGRNVPNCVPESLEESDAVNELNPATYPKDPRMETSSSFAAGWGDGWHDRHDPKKWSYGKYDMEQYQAGFDKGREDKLRYKTAISNKLRAEEQKFDHLSDEELRQEQEKFQRIIDRVGEDWRAQRKAMRGRDLPVDIERKLQADNRAATDALTAIHTVLSRRRKSGAKESVATESQQIDELRFGDITKTIMRPLTGSDLNSRIEQELKLAHEAFRIGDLRTGKHHFGRYMRLIKLSQSKERPAPAAVPKAEPVEERNVLKNIKRVATGRDITSRVRDELEQAGNAAERGDTEEAKRRNRRYDRLQRVGQKPEKVQPEKVDELFGFGRAKTSTTTNIPRRTTSIVGRKTTTGPAAEPASTPDDKIKRPEASIPRDLDQVHTKQELVQRLNNIGRSMIDMPNLDAARAIAAIEKRAKELGIDPKKIRESKNRGNKKWF